ncbi:helix-turn-helix domain-containing protein [Dorea amylophila]|uniref:helix-turn-helix domain-containing protein n=1 Tax=Dorea amylophila TaxID=2981789 RepID=UPI003B5063BA
MTCYILISLFFSHCISSYNFLLFYLNQDFLNTIVVLQKSCILLLQNRYHTIGDIASMVGFSNDNYFCKVFRKSLGITPTQYRIQNQNYDLVRVLHDSHPCVLSDK